MRVIGEIIFWNKERGWGFVEILKSIEGQPVVQEREVAFLHHSDIANRKIPHVNDLVTLVSEPSGNPKHPWRAREVTIVRAAQPSIASVTVEAVRQ